jgi:hypothetical protein
MLLLSSLPSDQLSSQICLNFFFLTFFSEEKTDDMKELDIEKLFMSKFKDISSASVKSRSSSLMPTKEVPKVDEPRQKSGTIAPSSTTPFLRREVKSNVRTRRVSGRVSDLSYEDPKELASVFEELRRGKIQWMMLSYTDIQENPYILKVNSKGEGGVDSYKKLFSDEEIYFIITRLDQDESLESVIEKLF